MCCLSACLQHRHKNNVDLVYAALQKYNTNNIHNASFLNFNMGMQGLYRHTLCNVAASQAHNIESAPLSFVLQHACAMHSVIVACFGCVRC